MSKYFGFLLFFVCSCAGMSFKFDKFEYNPSLKETFITKPDVVVLGLIEKKDFKYDQHVVSNFSEMLSHYFFENGISVSESKYKVTTNILLKDSKDTFFSDQAILHKNFIFIQGTLSESEFGNGLDSSMRSTVIIDVFNSSGNRIANSVYITDDTLSDSFKLRKICEKIVTKIVKMYDKK